MIIFYLIKLVGILELKQQKKVLLEFLMQKRSFKQKEKKQIIYVLQNLVKYLLEKDFLKINQKKKILLKIILINIKNYQNSLRWNSKHKVFLKENNGYFGAYETFFQLPSQFSIISKTKVSIIMLSSTEIIKIMSRDDLNIIKKNILKPYTDEQFINFYLEHQFWINFKKKVVETELKMYNNKNFVTQTKKDDRNFKKEMNYFQKNGTFKIECKQIYNPKILHQQFFYQFLYLIQQ